MFSTRGCTASGVLNFVTICACLCFCSIKGQTDGHLSCPDKWTRGDTIQLFCVMSINRYNSRCATPVNETYFAVDETKQCTINSTGFQQCSRPSPAMTPGCRCETNDTHFIFKYIFKVLETQSGFWTCQRLCQDSVGVPITLNITSDSTCTTVVQEKPNNEAYLSRVITIISVVLSFPSIGGIVFLILGIILICTTYERVIVFDEMKEDKKKKFVEELGSVLVQQRLQEFNQSPVCCCGKAEVKITGHEIYDDDPKPLRLLVTGRLIYYFQLKDRVQEVYKWIQEETLKPKASEQRTEPPPDYDTSS